MFKIKFDKDVCDNDGKVINTEKCIYYVYDAKEIESRCNFEVYCCKLLGASKEEVWTYTNPLNGDTNIIPLIKTENKELVPITEDEYNMLKQISIKQEIMAVETIKDYLKAFKEICENEEEEIEEADYQTDIKKHLMSLFEEFIDTTFDLENRKSLSK